MGAAATAWLLYLTPASGGFHDPATAATAAAFLPAVLVVRPWVHVPRWCAPLAGLASLAALASLTTSAAGWSQADSVAAQLLGLIAFVIAAGFARTPRRRAAVAAYLLIGIVTQFVPAWRAWFGSGDPNKVLVGTFYWHNQFGIWMTALGLLAAALAIGGPRRLSVVAAGLAALAGASAVLSTSRTDLALLVAGYLCLVPMALVRGRRRRDLLVWACLPVVTSLMLLFLTSAAFFDTKWTGVAAVHVTSNNPGTLGDRGTASLSTNGGDRWRWTKAALAEWRDQPFLGAGFGSFEDTVPEHVPATANVSAFVHNGYAEALTSGGAAFAVPLISFWVLVALAATRRFFNALRTRSPDGPVSVGTSLAVAVLLLHSGVDFDWHYPSLVVLLGVLGGLLSVPGRARESSRLVTALTATTLVAVVAVITTTSLVEHHDRAVSTAPARTAAGLLDARWWGTHDPRIDLAALQACLHEDGTLAVPRPVAVRAWTASGRSAALDPRVRAWRGLVGAAIR